MASGLGLALPVLAGVLPVASWLASPLIVAEPMRSVDAIVVLGAGSYLQAGNYDEVTLTPNSAYRLLRGVQLLKAGHARLMILSGGAHRKSRVSDAKMMAQVAAAMGADGSSLILDEGSTSTWQQAHSVARIVGDRGIRSIALVTSPLHSYRATKTFRRAGLEVISTPAQSGFDARLLTVGEDHLAGRMNVVIHSLYEYAAIATYRLRERL